jgi:hypothetical protein
MESSEMGKTMAKRESNRCVGMLLLGKKCHVHPRPDDIFSILICYIMICTVESLCVNSERFNLVK